MLMTDEFNNNPLLKPLAMRPKINFIVGRMHISWASWLSLIQVLVVRILSIISPKSISITQRKQCVYSNIPFVVGVGLMPHLDSADMSTFHHKRENITEKARTSAWSRTV